MISLKSSRQLVFFILPFFCRFWNLPFFCVYVSVYCTLQLYLHIDGPTNTQARSWLYIASPTSLFFEFSDFFIWFNGINIDTVIAVNINIIIIILSLKYYQQQKLKHNSKTQGERKQVRQLGLVMDSRVAMHLWIHLCVNTVKIQWTWFVCTCHPQQQWVKAELLVNLERDVFPF